MFGFALITQRSLFTSHPHCNSPLRCIVARLLNLAVLLSGSGRSLENLQQAIAAGRLSARIAW